MKVFLLHLINLDLQGLDYTQGKNSTRENNIFRLLFKLIICKIERPLKEFIINQWCSIFIRNKVILDLFRLAEQSPHGWHTLDIECKSVLSIGE